MKQPKRTERAKRGARSLKRVVRPLTRDMANRIRVLVDACATMESDDKLELMPGSKTFGGPALKNLASELNMLLHGHKPTTTCKEV